MESFGKMVVDMKICIECGEEYEDFSESIDYFICKGCLIEIED